MGNNFVWFLASKGKKSLASILTKIQAVPRTQSDVVITTEDKAKREVKICQFVMYVPSFEDFVYNQV